MNDEAWWPMFAHDPDRWERIAFDSGLAGQIDAADGDLREILASFILKFANADDEQTVTSIRRLYQLCLDAGMPVEHRRDVFDFVTGAVQNTSTIDVGVYMPFIVEDADPGIVSTATVDYTSLGSLIGDDPMTRPKELVYLIDTGECRTGERSSVACSASETRASAACSSLLRVRCRSTRLLDWKPAQPASCLQRPSSSSSIGWKPSMATDKTSCSAILHRTWSCRSVMLPFHS